MTACYSHKHISTRNQSYQNNHRESRSNSGRVSKASNDGKGSDRPAGGEWQFYTIASIALGKRDREHSNLDDPTEITDKFLTDWQS